MKKSLYLFVFVTAITLMMAGCEKEVFNPAASQPTESTAIRPRSLSLDEFIYDLIEVLRTRVQELIADGTLTGTNGNGILNRLDNIKKKISQGNTDVALNLLGALINHLDGLYKGGVLQEEIQAELQGAVQDIIDALEEQGCGIVPIVSNGLAIGLPISGSATLSPEIFDSGSFSACGEELTLSFSEDQSDQSIVFDCSSDNTSIIEIWVSNSRGKQNYAETYVLVQDNNRICDDRASGCAPVAIAYNGLAVDVSYGPVTIPATAFDAGSFDECGSEELSFAIKRWNSQTPQETVTFSCDDEVTTIVELTVSNGTYSTTVETYILVLNNTRECPVPPSPDCGPAPVMMNGVVLALPPIGQANLPAAVFERGSIDGCELGNLDFTITDPGQSPNFSTPYLSFDCFDDETSLVELYVRDEGGAQNYVESYVLVQRNVPLLVDCPN